MTEQQSGTITSLNREKGYGFIRCTRSNDIFFHFSTVRNAEYLNAGVKVFFTIGTGKLGKPAAVDVEIVDKGRRQEREGTKYVESHTEYTYSKRKKNSGLSGLFRFAFAVATGPTFSAVAQLGSAISRDLKTKTVKRTIRVSPAPDSAGSPNGRFDEAGPIGSRADFDAAARMRPRKLPSMIANGNHPLHDRLCPNCSTRLNGAKAATDGLGFRCPRCSQRVIR